MSRFARMDVRSNIVYGLKFCGDGRAEGLRGMARLVDLPGIAHLLLRLPVNSSG